jgi:hypothetical protein
VAAAVAQRNSSFVRDAFKWPSAEMNARKSFGRNTKLDVKEGKREIPSTRRNLAAESGYTHIIVLISHLMDFCRISRAK